MWFKVQMASFAAKNIRWIIVGIISFFVLTCGFFVMAIGALSGHMSVYSFGGYEEKLKKDYVRVGETTGVYWPDMVIFDGIRTEFEFNVDYDSIMKTADLFHYEKEICTTKKDGNGNTVYDENGNPERECERRVFYRTLEEVLEREGYDKETIEYLMDIKMYAYLFFDDFQDLDPSDFSGIFSWPVPGLHTITSMYGERIDPISGERSFHSGVDISGPNALGQTVVAIADGVVYTIRNDENGCGKWINIRHDDGFMSRYCHLSSIDVEEGMEVKRGDPIGKVGSTGRSTGPHLHLELKKDGNLVDPLPYIYSPN